MALSLVSLQLWRGVSGANPHHRSQSLPTRFSSGNGRSGRVSVRAGVGGGSDAPGSFLSLEEAGLVEMADIDMHEKFLCRLTISSLNLLRVIAKQEGVTVEELNAGIVCDWFQKDKAKREADINTATLKWESNDW